jgi:phage-related protein
MMTLRRRWRVIYYETQSGACPVARFLDGLERRARATALAAIDLLEEEGAELRRPYADYLRDGIYELRVRVSTTRYRVLYFFCDRMDIVLAHAIVKESARVPKAEIDRAIRCMEDWIGRRHEDPQGVPRERAQG